MMVSTEHPTVADVVFVIEGTANIGAHIDELKISYILPTLQYFSAGPPDPTDYGIDYSCTLYDLVIFHSADIAPNPPVQCSMPTTSTYKIVKWLNEIRFVGGAGERYSHIAEALSTALHVFDDITVLRGHRLQSKPSRHCILICNSPPYQLAVNESLSYAGLYCEQLVSLMASRGIHFTIFSPRKISQLFRLFEEFHCAREMPERLPMKDYSTDPRHMVLISGYQLEERSHTPKLEENKQTNERLMMQLAENAPSNSLTTSLLSSERQFKIPAVTAPSQTQSLQNTAVSSSQNTTAQSTTTSTPIAPTSIQPNVVPSMARPQASIAPMLSSQTDMAKNQQSSALQSQRQMFMNQGGMNIRPQVSNVTNSAALQPQAMPAGTMVTVAQSMPSQITHHGQGMAGMMTQNAPLTNTAVIPPQPSAMTSQTTTNPSLTRTAAPIQDIMTPANPSMPRLPAPGMQPRKIIWTGALEWQEKSKVTDATAKVSRSLACQVSVGVAESDLNASKWPNKLVMQLVPQTLINPLHDLFAQSRSVLFQFTNRDESYHNLFRVMSSGFAGCVHFPQVAQCDVRVLMLLYHNRRKMFMGIIPRDQNAFIQGIRQVITKHKKMTGNSVAVAGTSSASPQSIPPVTAQNPALTSQLPQTQGASGPLNTSNSVSGSSAVSEAERQANLQKIRALYQDLEAATQKERQFQQQQQFVPGPRTPMTIAQQRQHLQQPSNQTNPQPPPPSQVRMPMNVPQGTTQQQLRHLLLNQQQQQQQQQMHQIMQQQQRMPANQTSLMQTNQPAAQPNQPGFMDDFHMSDMM